MKNRTIAIIGIMSYVLSVFASAENLEGEFSAPFLLIVISAAAGIAFYVLAVIRLWHLAKTLSIMLIISFILLFSIPLIPEVSPSIYGSPIIIFTNVSRIFNFIVVAWAIIFLFRKRNN